MKIDAVFSGGGVKAYAFIGALESIFLHDYKLERVAGTSAGAIIAALIAAGYKLHEIQQLIAELDIRCLLDPPTITTIFPSSKWLLLYFQMGLYRGNKLEKWLAELFSKKNIYTFGDLNEKDQLKVVVSDLTLGKIIVIPDDLMEEYGIEPKNFPISQAVRMSAGFPYFFMPKTINGRLNQKSIIVDGGLLSNFPMWVFENKNKSKKHFSRPVLGIKLSESVEGAQPRRIKNAIDLFLALFSTMKQAHDARYISKSEQDNVVFIPVKEVKTLDFHLSKPSIQKLIELGKQHTDIFLNRWPR